MADHLAEARTNHLPKTSLERNRHKNTVGFTVTVSPRAQTIHTTNPRQTYQKCGCTNWQSGNTVHIFIVPIRTTRG
jgi:hypothetical protein